MVGLFILGMLAIAVLVGVMKRVDFDVPFISTITIFSLALMLMIEGMLAWMLLRGKKAGREVSIRNELNEQAGKEMYGGPTKGLSVPTFQPVSTVIEHTTRSLDQVPRSNQ
jgi:hypothetical protein